MTLGVALWGKTPEDLQRRLLAPYPQIPAGCNLADLRKLLQWTSEMRSAALALQRKLGALPSALSSASLWEARCEIVRRAIEYLERR
jgi:hypothetical protein